MKFIAIKTADGSITGNISFYCKMLHVTRQGFYKYLFNRERPWKYQDLAAAMLDIHSITPLRKCVTDITEIKASDGKLYVSAIFDCFDSAVLGLSIGANMQATLCVNTLDNAMMAYPDLKGAIIHSDRGSQYTSQIYRDTIAKYNVIQSMNSDGGRCHDNARCESMWARMKSELFYGRYDTRKLTKDEKIQDRIDRYLRKEMTPEESLNFEQDTLNNDELRKELGLTLLVRKSLASRQLKLDMTAYWKKQRKVRIVNVVTITSIAALFAIGFVLLKPNGSATPAEGMIAQNDAKEMPSVKEKQKRVAEVMKNVRKNNDDKEIVETIEELEKQNDIPSISQVSEKQYMSSLQYGEDNGVRNLKVEVYELYWMKIRSLLRMGKKDEAFVLLKQFVNLEGVHKTQADSLLKELEK